MAEPLLDVVSTILPMVQSGIDGSGLEGNYPVVLGEEDA